MWANFYRIHPFQIFFNQNSDFARLRYIAHMFLWMFVLCLAVFCQDFSSFSFRWFGLAGVEDGVVPCWYWVALYVAGWSVIGLFWLSCFCICLVYVLCVYLRVRFRLVVLV